jgi:hypothetical protein
MDRRVFLTALLGTIVVAAQTPARAEVATAAPDDRLTADYMRHRRRRRRRVRVRWHRLRSRYSRQRRIRRPQPVPGLGA